MDGEDGLSLPSKSLIDLPLLLCRVVSGIIVPNCGFHDLKSLMIDLNYRIDLSDSDVRAILKAEHWDGKFHALLKHDQVRSPVLLPSVDANGLSTSLRMRCGATRHLTCSQSILLSTSRELATAFASQNLLNAGLFSIGLIDSAVAL